MLLKPIFSLVLIFTAILLNIIEPPSRPCKTNCDKTVILGKEFTLVQGEIAKLKDTDFTVKIIKFEFNPASEFGGSKVYYEVTNGDNSIEVSSMLYDVNPETLPYYITVIDTDYSSSATFKIEPPETTCFHQEATKEQYREDDKNYCLINLTYKLRDEKFCYLITDQTKYDECFRSVAFNLGQRDLCDKLSTVEKRTSCKTDVDKKK